MAGELYASKYQRQSMLELTKNSSQVGKLLLIASSFVDLKGQKYTKRQPRGSGSASGFITRPPYST
jgi:hypothetical protein